VANRSIETNVQSDGSCRAESSSRIQESEDDSVSAAAVLEVLPEAPPVHSRAKQNAELIARLRSDPVAAAPLVYARFAPAVNRTVWRLLGADPDHNDVVQQVFYRVLKKAARVREPDKLDSWVQSVTANTVYELLRRRQVRRAFLKELPTETHADLVREVEVRDLLTQTKEIIEHLSPEDRIVFVLYYLEGLTLAELAEIRGCSVATAKRRVSRADRRFQYHLSQKPDLLSRLQRGKDVP